MQHLELRLNPRLLSEVEEISLELTCRSFSPTEAVRTARFFSLPALVVEGLHQQELQALCSFLEQGGVNFLASPPREGTGGFCLMGLGNLEQARRGLLKKMLEQEGGLAGLAGCLSRTVDSWLSRISDVPLPRGSRSLQVSRRTLVMGILNVTPDSFSDGGRFLALEAAVSHALRLVEEGADIIDVGGESTRPGASPVSEEEEIRRVVPVIEELSKRIPVPISIDTYKASVARRALEAGACIINDVTALGGDEKIASVAAETGCPVVLMHMKGEPRTMQDDPRYQNLLSEIIGYLRKQAALALQAGIKAERIIVDPGIGFGKTVEHNLLLIRHLRQLRSLGFPILVGPSRKSFIGKLLDLPVEERLEGTATAVACAILYGAHIVRVHDVKQMKRVQKICDAISKCQPEQQTAHSAGSLI
jgi:dihydropteroate synthase